MTKNPKRAKKANKAKKAGKPASPALLRATLGTTPTLTTPRAVRKSADLHHKVQKWIIAYLGKFDGDASDLNPGLPLPKQLYNARVMSSLVEAFRDEIAGPGWNIDPAKFVLGGPELLAAAKQKPFSYLIQYVYEKARAASR